MIIAKDTVVQLHYSLFDEQDQLIESTNKDAGGEAIAYLHGHNNMIAGFEQAVAGKEAGEHISITLTPDQAYGERQADTVTRVPVKHLQGAKNWKKGMVAWVETEQGTRQVTIVKVGRFMADVDTNHPLAGKTLKFEVDIVAVREATAEEIAHKHAHGAGGHQH
ncbi:FKBP-type peptidyl-prolyl cis-trans isomerase [Thalassolituus hydrocarboniclasticus]|uniref:Peptidyl-prolyl cis-trans isomerase n=1 Tax=Thalassolituus hydrocarboniclasticus TaxID=2742796 RepID=A0ABY6A7S3_9GAMM|nr:peptidylprolyl isomerase [Thalassolituus hydrocarboniclasticus]UXD86291.1 peptidylprolyl isomerase [Thalassolituus hydrocarboniclasticus]